MRPVWKALAGVWVLKTSINNLFNEHRWYYYHNDNIILLTVCSAKFVDV